MHKPVQRKYAAKAAHMSNESGGCEAYIWHPWVITLILKIRLIFMHIKQKEIISFIF